MPAVNNPRPTADYDAGLETAIHNALVEHTSDHAWLDEVVPVVAEAVRARTTPPTGPKMDRPAYELVRLIEAELDDGDQVTDTPQRPNTYTIWGIRALLEPYGGKAHRWQWPHCFECDHQSPLHNYGPCVLCGCAMTPEEIVAGARDEALDEAVMEALRLDAEGRVHPPGRRDDA